MSNIQSFDSFNEEKNWIKGAVKKPGSLRRALHKKKGEKISKKEIDTELQALRGKDMDTEKSGLQLGKRDARKHKKLVLARTFKSMHEDVEFDDEKDTNYAFFDNLHEIKKLTDKLLEKEIDIIEGSDIFYEKEFDLAPIKSQLQTICDTLDNVSNTDGEDDDNFEEMPLSDIDMPIKDKGMLKNPPFDAELINDEDDEEIGNRNSISNFSDFQ